MNEIIIDNRCCGIIKHVRLQMNCTQTELSRKLGVSQPMLCRIERREALPSESLLQKLAQLTGVTIRQLTGQDPIQYSVIC